MGIEIGPRGEPFFGLSVAASGEDAKTAVPIQVWIDTGFNGALQLPPSVVKTIQAKPIGVINTKIVGGTVLPVQVVEVDVFVNGVKMATCRAQVAEPTLLGTDFLQSLKFTFAVDYRNKQVYLTNETRTQKKTLKAFHKYKK